MCWTCALVGLEARYVRGNQVTRTRLTDEVGYKTCDVEVTRRMRRAAFVGAALALFAAGLLAACGGDSVADSPRVSTGGSATTIVLSGELTLNDEVDTDVRRVLGAMMITRCLERRFGLVVDAHASERSRWYGGQMLGRVSVMTSDPRSASPALTPGAELGFALDEQEAKKVERELRKGSALPLEKVFRREGNVVVVWEAPVPRKLRAG